MAVPTVPAFRPVTVLLVVVGSLLAGCGSGPARPATDDAQGAGSSATDSSPGQTDSGGDGPPPETRSTTTDRRSATGGESTAAGGTSSRSGTSDGSGEVVIGAAVAAARGFSDFSGLRVGVVASRASVVGDRSVIDLLAEAEGVDLAAIFAPEHGLRADVGAGESIEDGVDPVTGLPVHSLFGGTREPTPDMLAGIEVLVFDLQDVGARFYTYTSTMGLAMQSAARADIPFVVLDRPNPIGGSVTGGPVRDDEEISFISQYPIPSVHGLTAGELAMAIVGEGWLDDLGGLDLRVVPVAGWDREDRWTATGLAWVPPSPGLPRASTALVYPATVLFEATTVSYGQGTDHPFEQIGAPWLDAGALVEALEGRDLAGVAFRAIRFRPMASPSVPEPRFDGEEIPGVRIEVTDPELLDPTGLGVHLIDAVQDQARGLAEPVTVIDRPDFLDLLTGTGTVRRDLAADRDPVEIIAGWEPALAAFEEIRARYRLY